MASKKRKNEKEKKLNFIKKYWTGLLVALGISATLTGCGAAELEKEIKSDDTKENVEVPGQSIENEIVSSIDEEITFDEPEEEIVEEEETKEDEESLDVSKDKNTTITSNSDANYDYAIDLVIPIIKNFDTVSIVDALNEVDYDSSKASRAKLAVYFKIVTNPNEYKGTSEQNTLLLYYLRQYAKDFQNSAHDDYIKVIDNSTIENSDNGNYSYSNDNENNPQEDNPQGNPDDNEKKPDDKPKKHKHKFGKWLPFDDELEYRECPKDGEREYQDHPSYREWIDNGDDTKSRTCDNCGHTMTKNYVWGNWIAIDDEKEYREREDGKREEQDHPYGDWIDNEDGTKSRTCPNCGRTMTKDKEIEKPDHEHKFEAKTPVSLNRTDEEHCKVIDYECSCGTINEALREYLPHKFQEKPDFIAEDLGYYSCGECGLYITKPVSNTNDENTPTEDEQIKDESVVINFDFDIPPRNNEDYEYFDEEYSEELEEDNTLLLEDKGTPLMIEDKQASLQDAIASFDKELYKKLFKKKVALEQSLAANKGIESEKELQLLGKIDAVRSSMVQKLAESLVKEELRAMEQESAPTLGLRG